MEDKVKKTWKDGDHHILPKNVQKKYFSTVVNDTTVHVSGKDHVKLHKDIKEVGPYGALSSHEIRKALRRKKVV